MHKLEKWFKCPECNHKMIGTVHNIEWGIRIKLRCTNGMCGACMDSEMSSDKKIISEEDVIDDNLYPIIRDSLRNYRKRVRHSDYHDEELYPQIDGQITIDELIKKEKNNE